MHHLVACIFCGGIDPNADSLLLQAAIAGGITAPWMLRARLLAFAARLRGRTPAVGPGDACSIQRTDEMDPHADR